MSSDSVSTGSTLGQFGLYRSIDARTEEFLRLSKKKQIRRGCACAAVSTAITVTVVVGVLLIYEYSINSKIQINNKFPFKATWSGLNQSDITNFDENYLKSQLNIDDTTFKLLPVLLKVLKQYKYLEDINNEPKEPIYQKKTEYHKNIFDFRNFIKYPSSRLYSIEYKTTPVMYYRNPTQTIEHFSKLRKIRDYQRVLKYVEKMISEKVGSPVLIIKRELTQTEETTTLSTTPINNISTKKGENYANEKRIERLCKCPKKLGELLTKLISSIQKLLGTPFNKAQTKCTNENSLKKINVNNTTNTSYKNTINNNKISKDTKNNNLLTTDTRCCTKSNALKSTKEHRQQNLNTISSVDHLLNENEIKKMRHDVTNEIIETPGKTSTVQNFIEGTLQYYTHKTTTIPIKKASPKRKQNTAEVTKGDIFKINGFQNERNNYVKYPFLRHEEYDDFFPTTPDVTKEFNSLDVHALELVRSKMIPTDKQIPRTKNKFSDTKLADNQLLINYPDTKKGLNKKASYLANVFKQSNYLKDLLLKLNSITNGTKTKNKNNMKVTYQGTNIIKHLNNCTLKRLQNDMNDEKTHKQAIIRKNSYLVNYNTTNKNSAKADSIKPKDNWESVNKATIMSSESKLSNHTEVEINNSISFSENKPKLLKKVFNKTKKHARDSYSASELKANDEFVEYDIDKMIEQDMEEENIIKQVELEIEKHPKISIMDLIQSKLEKLPTEILEVTEIPKPETPKSMISHTRPIYLEIQRNSWKQEEMQDFDTNVANNLFDLPVV